MKVRNFILITLGIIAWLFFVAAVIYDFSTKADGPNHSGLRVLPPTQQDPILLEKARAMNIDLTNITLRYGETSSETRVAEYIISKSEGTISYEIIVRPGAEKNDEYLSIAHEYYHYIWDVYEIEKSPIITALSATYYSYTPLKERMAVYLEKGLLPSTAAFNNELWAVECTEVTSNALTPDITKECNKWVNRSVMYPIY